MLAKSSTPSTRADLEPPVVRLERQAVDELHQAGHRFAAGQMGDVDPFDRPRRVLQLEHFLQAGQPLLRVDEEHLGLDVRVQFAALVERFQHLDFVAQPGGRFELAVPRPPRASRPSSPRAASACSPPETSASRWMSRRYSSFEIRKLHGAVHWSIEANRQGRNQRHFSSASSMSRLQVRNLKIFCSTCNRAAQAAGAGERAVQLRAPLVRLAGELDPRKILANENLQIGKRLVVLQVLVELRLHVLDQPGFDQQGVDLALGLDVVDVGNLRDQFGRAPLVGRRLQKIAAARARRFLALPT